MRTDALMPPLADALRMDRRKYGYADPDGRVMSYLL